MADQKLSVLTELATTPDATDELYINDGGVSKKIQYSNLVPSTGFSADANGLVSGDVTLDEATGDEVAYTLDYTTNKATSGNDTGLLINQTDTLSPGTSLLADFQVATASKFSVDNAGSVAADSFNASGVTGLTVAGATNTIQLSAGYWLISNGGNRSMALKNSQCSLRSDAFYGFSSSLDPKATNDVTIYRDAANTLALRNSTAAQTLNVYNTYTDASNYERGFLKWNTNVLEIGTEAAGTGTARNVDIVTAGGDIGFICTGTKRFRVSAQKLEANTNGGGSILDEIASATNPVLTFRADVDTGLGKAADDQLSLIAGGVEQMRLHSGTASIQTGLTVATLPGTPAVGMIARVTDANSPAIGSTVAGSGSSPAMVWYNGTNWTVIGV